MTEFSALLVPIILSAVIVFIASSIIHMLTPWHKNDFKGVPNEEKFRETVGPMAIPPGDYTVPHCNSMDQMRSPEFVKKMADGPVIMMTVIRPGPPTVGAQMGQWFLFTVVISAFSGFIASRALAPMAPYKAVFHFVALSAFLGYSGGIWPMAIWYKKDLGTTIRSTLDGLFFALLTAGTFGWLWPK